MTSDECQRRQQAVRDRMANPPLPELPCVGWRGLKSAREKRQRTRRRGNAMAGQAAAVQDASRLSKVAEIRQCIWMVGRSADEVEGVGGDNAPKSALDRVWPHIFLGE